MDCPHCGGAIDSGQPKPIKHACFDDRWHAIVVGDEVRRLTVSQWRLLLLLRERFRRFVPLHFLTQWSARDPEDGGDVPVLRLMVMRVRVRLKGSPFTIASQWGFGYGLFPVDEVRALKLRDGRTFTRSTEGDPAATVQQWIEGRRMQPRWRGPHGTDRDYET